MTHIIRFASILQALEDSFQITHQLKSVNKFLINKELEIDSVIKKSNPRVIITFNCFENAKRLILYFNLHRLTMAGYDYNNLIFATNESTLMNFLLIII